MAVNLPSRFSKPVSSGASSPAPAGTSSQPYSAPPSFAKQPGAASDYGGVFAFISVLALIISVACFYGTFFMERPLTPGQKASILGVAQELRALQDKDVSLISSPVQTTISLDKQYPIKDLFPPNFNIPLSFNIPIDTQLVGISTTGQPAAFRVQENVPIKLSVPISSSTAFGNNSIRIQKEMPVDVRFTSSVKIRAAFGTQINGIIDQLDKMVGEPTSSG